MYAIEVRFKDGLSKPEMLLVKRPQALIGASDYAHVVIDDMASLSYQIRLSRSLGRVFHLRKVGDSSEQAAMPFSGEGTFDAGDVSFRIFALDPDLIQRGDETPDRAGVRVLRSACASSVNDFPAVLVGGGDSVAVSFPENQSVLVGRSNQCAVRLDSSEISGKHARVGFELGGFWVEDLGSTNGTFVAGKQVSGRIQVESGQAVFLGRETVIYPVASAEDMSQADSQPEQELGEIGAQQSQAEFPCIFSVAEVVRPARVVLGGGETIVVGRDPNCDLWIGAPHVSRRHLFIHHSPDGTIEIEDNSTNGTAYDGGMLRKGDVISVDPGGTVLNFGKGITLAICLAAEQQETFEHSGGAVNSFRDADGAPRPTIHAKGEGSSILGTHMINTGRLYRRLSFPMKVFIATVFCGFFAVLYVLVQLMINQPGG